MSTKTSTKEEIITTLARLGKASVSQVLASLDTPKSRIWISRQLNELIKEKRLIRARSGKYLIYALPQNESALANKFTKHFVNTNLSEDRILVQIKSESPILNSLGENVASIINYAFTEMFNNSIEHSQSKHIDVNIEKYEQRIAFEIRDHGVGIFRNIMEKKRLSSELEAIQELLKGKTTTLPHSHTGEGIFFTSKVADLFILNSYGNILRIDNTLPDLFIDKAPPLVGTLVRFEIGKSSNKHLNDIFAQYQAEPDSYAFDKTKIHVKLYKAGNLYISRSQGRRLMSNLDKFKVVILDFDGIETVGQAFADEVFRVFASQHPNTMIESVNMSEGVKFMVGRVEKPQLSLNIDAGK